MSEETDNLRAGDADRDDAISLLQDHLAAGRLDHAEFDERISRALQARTQQELRDLFTDLPGRRPGDPSAPTAPVSDVDPAHYQAGGQQPAPYAAAPPAYQRPERPWYAQWWIILVAVAANIVSKGRLGPLIPIAAVWIWVVWPYFIRDRMRRGQAGTYPTYGPPAPRALNHEQRLAIEAELGQGRKIYAIKLYRQYTGAGLADAKLQVENLERQLGR
ncbi:hypothetical protein CGZ93_00070 [Enemella dayhoffiae]|uniref:DUF1707 domain-containing protein n=1 Tax=Enemella dayhoffiae TaxID=2016507 RepID=A0A255HAZ3_9ACTN|nr:DUF1707 domain-containing protein [Enemella dayhoffiae]OYO24920.1 hypothetical protein CGZ93_00070 [Enemella dayhoffiae]